MMKKTWILAAGGLVVFAFLAVLFGIYDLQIIMQFYDPFNRVAQAFEEGGILTMPIILALCVHLCIHLSSKHLKWLHIPVAFFIILVIAIFCGGFDTFWQEVVLLVVYATFLIIILQIKSSPAQTAYLYRVVCIALLACALTMFLCIVLKELAGRLRFRDMQNVSQFVPWYQFHPFSGNQSFPSGHTMNATATFVFCLLAPVFKNRLVKSFCYILPVLFVLSMAITRMMMGAHYPSDVLFSIGIAVVVWSVLYHLLGKPVAKVL